MALGRAHSVAVSGVDGHLVEIEADIGRGLPGVHLVGLPDTALQESRDRVRAAVTFPVKSACLWLETVSVHECGHRATGYSVSKTVARFLIDVFGLEPRSRSRDEDRGPGAGVISRWRTHGHC